MHLCGIVSGSLIGLIGVILVCLPVPQPELTIQQKLENPSPEQQTALINSIVYQTYEFKRCMAGVGLISLTVLTFVSYIFYDSHCARRARQITAEVSETTQQPPRPTLPPRPPTPPRPKTARPSNLTPIEIIEYI